MHENIGHTNVFGTSSVGCDEKTNITACHFSCVYVKRPGCTIETNINGMSVFVRLRQTARMRCKSQYKRYAHARNRCFRHCGPGCVKITSTNGMSVLSRLRQHRSQQQQHQRQQRGNKNPKTTATTTTTTETITSTASKTSNNNNNSRNIKSDHYCNSGCTTTHTKAAAAAPSPQRTDAAGTASVGNAVNTDANGVSALRVYVVPKPAITTAAAAAATTRTAADGNSSISSISFTRSGEMRFMV